MDCCVNNLGEFPHNADIDTGIIALVDGEYTLKLDIGGSSIIKKVTPGIGENIVIARPFNENFTYKLTIKDPNGDLVEEDECSNFSFKTFVAITPPCPEPDCEDEDIEYY
jgi:hypothetical protein